MRRRASGGRSAACAAGIARSTAATAAASDRVLRMASFLSLAGRATTRPDKTIDEADNALQFVKSGLNLTF